MLFYLQILTLENLSLRSRIIQAWFTYFEQEYENLKDFFLKGLLKMQVTLSALW